MKNLSGNISVLHNFFGLYQHHSFPPGFIPDLSVLKQIRLLKSFHINLNSIIVSNNPETKERRSEISGAITRARHIFSKANIGIGRIRHYYIPQEKLNGRNTIEGKDEFWDLVEGVSVPNDGLDVFFVDFIGIIDDKDVAGYSPIGGSVGKGSGRDGLAVEIPGNASNAIYSGKTLAHELRHYLGLCHEEEETDTNNLMFPHGDLSYDAQLSEEQVNDMQSYLFIHIVTDLRIPPSDWYLVMEEELKVPTSIFAKIGC